MIKLDFMLKEVRGELSASVRGGRISDVHSFHGKSVNFHENFKCLLAGPRPVSEANVRSGVSEF